VAKAEMAVEMKAKEMADDPRGKRKVRCAESFQKPIPESEPYRADNASILLSSRTRADVIYRLRKPIYFLFRFTLASLPPPLPPL
jgi:hypothetical protein